MSPNMLRQFWSLIEATRSNIPITLDDRSLTQWLLRQAHSDQSFNTSETDLLSAYIQARLPLIRDLAQEYQPSC